jgi:DNA-binding transcriptional regulator GbsR (MarR family)
MEFAEGKQRFIESWGKLGSQWGISRTMAQIHALLLISPEPMCADQIMKELEISRGNVNMNLRALDNWRIVHKVLKKGDRKEYFVAEKDIWKVCKQIIRQRKQKELEPMRGVLSEISEVEGVCEHSREFCKMIEELNYFSGKADKMLDKMVETESNWLTNTFTRLIS